MSSKANSPPQARLQRILLSSNFPCEKNLLPHCCKSDHHAAQNKHGDARTIRILSDAINQAVHVSIRTVMKEEIGERCVLSKVGRQVPKTTFSSRSCASMIRLLVEISLKSRRDFGRRWWRARKEVVPVRGARRCFLSCLRVHR